VVKIPGFSAHADRNDLLNWLSQLKKPPIKLFVVHGESESASNFADFVREKKGWDVVVPNYNDEVVLN
jgi:metallo-beta-lactamase family protein